MTRKLIFFRLSSLVLGLLIGLVLIELLTRILFFVGICPSYTAFEFIRQSPHYVWSQFTGPTFVRKEKIYNFYGNKLRINRYGYRGKAVSPEKKAGASRIIFMGGSQTFDLAAKEGKDWPTLAGNLLNQSAHQVEVLNAGMPGHHSWDCLGKLYSELYMWKPDVVVINEAWNDIKYFQNLSPENSLMAKNLSSTQISNLNHSPNHLRVLDLLGWSLNYSKNTLYHPERLPKTNQDRLKNNFSEWGPKQYALHLELIYHLCKRINAKLVIMKQPRLVSESNSAEERKTIAYQWIGLDHTTLIKAFEACDLEIEKLKTIYPDISVLDASSIMTGHKEFFIDHVHTTELGSEKLASIVAERISPLLSKLPNQNKEKENL